MKEQVDLFALFGIGNLPETETAELTVEDYLKRADKIESLVRETKGKKKFQVSSVMEALCKGRFFSAMEKADTDYGSSVLRYLLSVLSKLAAKELADGTFPEIFGDFKDLVVVSSLEKEQKKRLNSLRKHSASEKEDSGFMVNLPLTNWEENADTVDESWIFVDRDGNIQARYNGAKLKFSKGELYRRYCNPDVFSILLLLSYIRKRVREDMKAYGEESVLYRKLLDIQKAVLEKSVDETGVVKVCEGACLPYVTEYMEENGVKYERCSNSMTNLSFPVLQGMDFIPLFLMAEKPAFVLSFVMASLREGRSWKWRRFIAPAGMWWQETHTRILVDILWEMTGDYRTQKQEAEYEERLRRDYAGVWETKKNIPEKVLKAMAESSFNDTFGYVEFDETCDLDKIRELEKEWKAVRELLGLSEYKDTALRFRKLGNHKAVGLYFPFFRCLCVDLRCPSSMVHEVFHMIDFHEGCLSDRYSFYRVRRVYEECLRAAVGALPDGDSVKERMMGRTKYNMSYYLTPSEIFARCGEMYMIRILGVDNSLVKPEEGIEYPDNTELMEMVRDYFDRYFKERRDAA